MKSAPLCLVLAMLAASGCTNRPEPAPVDRAVEYQGGNALDRVDLQFDFRGRSFRVSRFDGLFRFERAYVDTTGARIVEVLENDGFTRYVDGSPAPLTEERDRAYRTSVNSVVYFALLPYPLRDPGARIRRLGHGSIGGQTYDEVEVTFTPEDGGLDYEDRFVYWFDPDTGAMRYMAYYYHTDGGGSRFREVVNERTVGGVVFSDHLNYRAEPDTVDIDQVHHFDELFDAGAVTRVSVVRLDSLVVRPLESSGPIFDR